MLGYLDTQAFEKIFIPLEPFTTMCFSAAGFFKLPVSTTIKFRYLLTTTGDF
jgi:hypothetical protein